MTDLTSPGINVLWPGFRSGEDYSWQFYRAWMPHVESNPHIYHALVGCASAHCASKNGHIMSLESEQLRHRVKTIQSIREAVSTPGNGHNVEALLIAILILALNNDPTSPSQTDRNPFTPPLKDMQWLSHYAQSRLHPSHWNAMQSLVKTYGGIENLTIYGLPWLLS
jgi:hypothetical protein